MIRYLLSHPGESAISRHRLSRDAEVSFTILGMWMKNGTNWEGALTRGKANSRLDGRSLYAPDALLAILVIAYPDTRLQDRIRKLQIDWMMRPRVTLGQLYRMGSGKGSPRRRSRRSLSGR